ncbi:MAG: ribbon-helix-helix protein, CopG family [Promethearchaeota archaeon]|nr:MAG: ribbon-helix-helix protein, CopG family [Candidatus Lokiarchaeota archaeon]
MSTMKIITINLPEKYLSAIKILNDLGIYPSRSEAIRIALRDFLTNELKMYEDLDEESLPYILKSRINKLN